MRRGSWTRTLLACALAWTCSTTCAETPSSLPPSPCQAYQTVAEKQIAEMKKLIDLQDDRTALLRKQRDEAIMAQAPGQPFYVWLIVGAAAGVVLTRGLR